MTSIIIPCYIIDKELEELTKKCLASIKKNTKDYNLILIDNGSKYKSVFGEADILIRNKENLGYAKAVNQGIKLAEEKFVVLNNDTEVFPNWLKEMLKMSKVGIVFPCSNQGRDDKEFKDLKDSGHCWLSSQEIVERVGYLDERFRVATFEDTDYFRRAIKCGFNLEHSAAKVKHYWRATFDKIPNHEQIFKNNETAYKKKWFD